MKWKFCLCLSVLLHWSIYIRKAHACYISLFEMSCPVDNVLTEVSVNTVSIIQMCSRESPKMSGELNAASFIKLHSWNVDYCVSVRIADRKYNMWPHNTSPEWHKRTVFCCLKKIFFKCTTALISKNKIVICWLNTDYNYILKCFSSSLVIFLVHLWLHCLVATSLIITVFGDKTESEHNWNVGNSPEFHRGKCAQLQ